MTPQALRIEARRLDLDRVRREVVRHARRDRREPLRHAEAERELLVVPGRPHRDRDRLTADADLERLLDGDDVAFTAPAREPQRVDAVRRVRRRLGRFPTHADQRTRGRAEALPRATPDQPATAQTANTVIDQLEAVAVTSRTLAR